MIIKLYCPKCKNEKDFEETCIGFLPQTIDANPNTYYCPTCKWKGLLKEMLYLYISK